jgi:hypothetical protein
MFVDAVGTADAYCMEIRTECDAAGACQTLDIPDVDPSKCCDAAFKSQTDTQLIQACYEQTRVEYDATAAAGSRCTKTREAVSSADYNVKRDIAASETADDTECCLEGNYRGDENLRSACPATPVDVSTFIYFAEWNECWEMIQSTDGAFREEVKQATDCCTAGFASTATDDTLRDACEEERIYYYDNSAAEAVCTVDINAINASDANEKRFKVQGQAAERFECCEFGDSAACAQVEIDNQWYDCSLSGETALTEVELGPCYGLMCAQYCQANPSVACDCMQQDYSVLMGLYDTITVDQTIDKDEFLVLYADAGQNQVTWPTKIERIFAECDLDNGSTLNDAEIAECYTMNCERSCYTDDTTGVVAAIDPAEENWCRCVSFNYTVLLTRFDTAPTDGKFTIDEFSAMFNAEEYFQIEWPTKLETRFDECDNDNNGKLDDAEIGICYSMNCQSLCSDYPSRTVAIEENKWCRCEWYDYTVLLSSYDTDNDGEWTRTEFDAMWDPVTDEWLFTWPYNVDFEFDQCDRSGDGELDADEVEECFDNRCLTDCATDAQVASRTDQWCECLTNSAEIIFEQFDTNSDRTITRAEFAPIYDQSTDKVQIDWSLSTISVSYSWSATAL